MKILKNSNVPIYQQIKELDLRRVEQSLTEAISAEKIVGMSNNEVVATPVALWEILE